MKNEGIIIKKGMKEKEGTIKRVRFLAENKQEHKGCLTRIFAIGLRTLKKY